MGILKNVFGFPRRKFPVWTTLSTLERITVVFTFRLSEDWLHFAWTPAHLDCCPQINEWLPAAPLTLRVMNRTDHKTICRFLHLDTRILPNNSNCALPPIFLNLERSDGFRKHVWFLIQSHKLVYTNWCIIGTHASLPYSITLCGSCVMNLDFYESTLLASGLKMVIKDFRSSFLTKEDDQKLSHVFLKFLWPCLLQMRPRIAVGFSK